MPITGVMNISCAGRIEMNAIDTPASVPSSAARGVILRTIGATKPPAISTKLWTNTQTRPASQPLIGIAGLERDRQHDHEHDDEHVRHADARRQRADVGAPGLLREPIGEPRVVAACDSAIISPAAGRMRPNTRSSGIFSTKRSRPVSTSRLTRMLVPKPKKRVPVAGRPQRRLVRGHRRRSLASTGHGVRGHGRTAPPARGANRRPSRRCRPAP